MFFIILELKNFKFKLYKKLTKHIVMTIVNILRYNNKTFYEGIQKKNLF